MKEPRNRIGLALSGGGSRAIAFHLGCFRALHRLGILDRVSVISCVSGGSVIGALYAYSGEPFAEYDKRVQRILRRGLQRALLFRYFWPPRILLSLMTALTSGLAALCVSALRLLMGLVVLLCKLCRLPIDIRFPAWRPPFRRWFSRTTAFEAALRGLFGKRQLPAVERDGLEVVINACDLRTSSAFRFGSRTSGCSRFGEVKQNDIAVATAVAASAAYPALLPALDRHFDFQKTGHNPGGKERVILTDGGVYDNLGISCFEPGRSSAHTAFVYKLDYIICCDAGHGQTDGTAYPYWWPSRMSQAFETVFKKSTDASRKLLDYFGRAPNVKGFVHAYLGQKEHPFRNPFPPDFVPRERVCDYPTDFAAMRDSDIEALSRRGEQLTEMLVRADCPALVTNGPLAQPNPSGGPTNGL